MFFSFPCAFRHTHHFFLLSSEDSGNMTTRRMILVSEIGASGRVLVVIRGKYFGMFVNVNRVASRDSSRVPPPLLILVTKLNFRGNFVSRCVSEPVVHPPPPSPSSNKWHGSGKTRSSRMRLLRLPPFFSRFPRRDYFFSVLFFFVTLVCEVCSVLCSASLLSAANRSLCENACLETCERCEVIRVMRSYYVQQIFATIRATLWTANEILIISCRHD